LNYAGIWKSIKKIDKDSNGYVTIEELDEIIREWFPLEMESKTMNRWLRGEYGSVANKHLINYKQLKNDINAKLIGKLAPEDQTPSLLGVESLTRSHSMLLHKPSLLKKPQPAPEDDLRIDGHLMLKPVNSNLRSITPVVEHAPLTTRDTSDKLPSLNRNISM
jgi:hypothetical protein